MYKTFFSTLIVGHVLMAGLANAQSCSNTAIEQSTPTSQFSFNADGTVTDNVTGLMWKRCLEGQTYSNNGTPTHYLDDKCNGSTTYLNWMAALKQAQTANAANSNGYSDWRVPNLKELKSIVEHCRIRPAINTEVFLGDHYGIWTSTPINYPGYPSKTWGVQFDNGDDYWSERKDETPVRLVRAGK